ncbi:hypothetical protein LLG95_15735 [bacterium]|nr:hypothetical protein [bacterium]
MAKRLFLLFAIVMLSGCMSVPYQTIHSENLSAQRDSVYGFKSGHLHFLVVTDGNVSDYNFGTSWTGPYWEAWIQQANKAVPALPMKCGSRNMYFGGLKYPLANGRGFVIRTKGSQPYIQQIPISEETQIRGIIQAEQRFETGKF